MIVHNCFLVESLIYIVGAFYPEVSLICIMLNPRHLRLSPDLRTNKYNDI